MDKKNDFTQIGEFYNNDDIALFWEMINKRHMHVPYYDKTNMDASISQAARKLTDIMVEKAVIKENEYFIDIGCGFGLPAIELAKRKNCNVYGITASDYQRSEAEKVAAQEKVAHLAKFFVYDAKNTPFENNKFDGGWFFESIFHIGHEEAMMEARRILKPGAVLLLTDFLALPTLTEEGKKDLFEKYHIKSMKTFEEYPRFCEENGFDLLELADVTEQTIKMRGKKYVEAMEANKSEIVKKNGIEFYEKMKELENATNEFLEKYVGYAIVLCRKK